MTVHVHDEAGAEIQEAVAWYERQRAGLGQEFLAAVNDAFETIARSPQAFTQVKTRREGSEIRRYAMPRFPYSVIYQVSAEDVVILTVGHQRRRPDYWQERVE